MLKTFLGPYPPRGADFKVFKLPQSGVRAVPLGVAAEQSVNYFGPSGVCALSVCVAVEGSVHFY